MVLSVENREQVAGELKRFATSLNLSEEQKQKLHAFLTEAHEKLQNYKSNNPHVSREELIDKVADNRTAIRERLVHFLSPEQLAKWDAEIGKAKEFMGHRIAA